MPLARRPARGGAALLVGVVDTLSVAGAGRSGGFADPAPRHPGSTDANAAAQSQGVLRQINVHLGTVSDNYRVTEQTNANRWA